jgi:hypothetical protein
MRQSTVVAGIRSSMASKAMISSLGQSQRIIVRHGGELSERKLSDPSVRNCEECPSLLDCNGNTCSKKKRQRKES